MRPVASSWNGVMPDGLRDYLAGELGDTPILPEEPFVGQHGG